MDGHQMYFGGSDVGRASTIGETSPIHTLIITGGGGQQVRNLASFETPDKFEPPASENAAIYPNSETKVQCRDDRPMSLPSLVKLGPRTPENALSVLPHPKTCTRKRAKSSITQPRIIRISLKFCTDFDHVTLDVPHSFKVNGSKVKEVTA